MLMHFGTDFELFILFSSLSWESILNDTNNLDGLELFFPTIRPFSFLFEAVSFCRAILSAQGQSPSLSKH